MSFDPPASRDITEVDRISATTPEAPPTLTPTERLTSIDALRGFDMFWIMGAEDIVHALAKWWGPTAHAIDEQFEHCDWEGFRFYDLIFPLFLFTIGVVIPFSLRKHTVGSHPKGSALIRIARRVVLLFLLGLVINGLLRLNFDTLRIAGVLQRMAIGYGLASLIFLFTKTRTQAVLFVAILVGYWAILMYVPSPESKAGDLSKETNLAGYVDRHYLLGKIYKGYYGYGDNEGLLSTIPAIATALLGVMAGNWLLSQNGKWIKSLGLAAMGLACLGLGLLWSHEFPLIKNLWTSSFVLVTGGWSLLLLSLFYTIIDVVGFRAWAFPFVVIGMNAITIYVGQKIIPFDEIAQNLLGGAARLSGSFGPSLLAIGTVAVAWLFLFHLYRNRIFLRV